MKRMGRGKMAGGVVVGGVVVIGLVAGAAIVRAMGGSAAAPAAGLPVAFKPVLTVEQLMENQEKAFKGLKAAVLDQKWKDARLNAWLLAELANVNRQHAEQEKYSEFAGRMSEACLGLAADLKKKDAKLAKEGISRIGSACNSCHDVYQKKKD